MREIDEPAQKDIRILLEEWESAVSDVKSLTERKVLADRDATCLANELNAARKEEAAAWEALQTRRVGLRGRE